MSRIDSIKYALIILGVALLFSGLNMLKDSKTTPVDYSSLKESDMKKGLIIEGDLVYNFGAFEENYDEKYGQRVGGSTNYKYAIPIEEKFMGFEVREGAVSNVLDNQAENTFKYMIDERAIAPAKHHFLGKVYKLSSQSTGFFKEFLISAGFSASEADEAIVQYYIKEADFDRWPGFVIPGVSCLAAGGLWVFLHKRHTGSFF